MKRDNPDLDAEWTEDVLRDQWSKRETSRIYESRLARIGDRTELARDEFRYLARYMFSEFPQLRRKALLSGTITLADGRVIRRAGHVDIEGTRGSK